MSTPQSIALLARELKLSTFADYQQVLRLAAEKGLGYEEFLHEMLTREVSVRKENQVKKRIRDARFPLVKTLDEFKFDALPHVKEALVWQLATGEFIQCRENIVMIGNPDPTT
ncbi:ATP-binding protein [Desulfofundulus sp. TPOSR]|uniref:ATP-binding protein n=1 Tax=Desulfofundulus sp. TPOSR TaxID=2714340 RepID=UPI0014090936|nr:ATP-binding protein [Desulfofundulus sp. TPOSR]NHM28619.1 ATP-binding protein [Desulfofundulus sp. TPOSR]